MRSKKSEKEVFSELSELCTSPGYAHALAFLCFKNQTIQYSDQITTKDILEQHAPDHLLRTELSTLVGLACQKTLDTTPPPPKTTQGYIDKTESLLKKLHESITAPIRDIFSLEKINAPEFNPFRSGNILRESIFYGGDSAYSFQYESLSKIKYLKDNDWLLTNKGFSIEQAALVINTIEKIQNQTINDTLRNFQKSPPDKWTFFDAYTFTLEQIRDISALDIKTVKNVVDSFSMLPGEECFNAIDDFNPRNAYPIIPLQKDRYVLFSISSLQAALYETPFFWFNADDKYKNKAMQNRGDFAEDFSEERLRLVFGKGHVFKNVNIIDSTKNRVGEIDVLVVFANRAIVLQAKSKKLTIAARKGNDQGISDDFKKAVQDAYDQAYSCSLFLTDKNYVLKGEDNNEIKLSRDYKEIYPICLVSEHYPMLAFQTRQFLLTKEHTTIQKPFVMDVFFLDVMTEMLPTPLYFLSYIHRRTSYGERILSAHETTVLSFHLQQNLLMDDEISMIHLHDDISTDLDIAMQARRTGMPGKTTPNGILTVFKNTAVEILIKQIEDEESRYTLDFGLFLLSIDTKSINKLNKGINYITAQSRQDEENHDITVIIEKTGIGLTIHSNMDPFYKSIERLKTHAEYRKYVCNADKWFGACINPETSQLISVIELFHKWQPNVLLDTILNYIPPKKASSAIFDEEKSRVGRNDPCPCGSGLKYKKCCMI